MNQTGLDPLLLDILGFGHYDSVKVGNTKGGSITVPLTSSLTVLD